MEKEFMENEKLIIQALFYGIIFLVLLTTGLILFFHYSRQKIVQKELEKAALKLENQLKILQTSIAIQEIERKRIAQDLHDAISSKLNIISLTTHVLLDDETLSKTNHEALEHILAITTKTLESSRMIAHKLMPPILDKFGLKVALEELFEEFCSNSTISIEHDIQIENIDKEDELHIFRIIQELINNSIVHGKATVLTLNLIKKDSDIQLKYHDNGLGFNKNEVSKKPGIGLQNIKSRVAILNGTLNIISTKSTGSSFTINIENYER